MAPPPKSGMPTYGIVLIVVGVFVGLLCAGGIVLTATGQDQPTRSPGTTANPPGDVGDATTAAVKTAQLGGTLVIEGSFGARAIHYTLSDGKSYTKAPQYDLKPDKGAFYSVNATVEAKKGSTYASIFDFALVAADGSVYEPTLALGFDNVLSGTQINEGQKTSGLVVFDLPPAAVAKAKIELRADFFSSGDAGFWQLP